MELYLSDYDSIVAGLGLSVYKRRAVTEERRLHNAGGVAAALLGWPRAGQVCRGHSDVVFPWSRIGEEASRRAPKIEYLSIYLFVLLVCVCLLGNTLRKTDDGERPRPRDTGAREDVAGIVAPRPETRSSA